MNPVLQSLLEQRQEQISTADAILSQVEGRDLVDTERSLLTAVRERIGVLDAQIETLEGFETLRDAHAESLAALPRPDRLPAVARRADGGDRTPEYASQALSWWTTCEPRDTWTAEPDQIPRHRPAWHRFEPWRIRSPRTRQASCRRPLSARLST